MRLRRRRRPCGARVEPGSPGAPRSRCACRPAATKRAATASSRRRAGPAAQRAARRDRFGEVARVVACRLSRRSRSPAFTSDRTAAISATATSLTSARAAVCADWACRRPVPHQLAGADGLHARRSSILSRASPRFAPHFHLPLQHGATACWRRCGGLYTVGVLCRTPRRRIRARLPDASIGSDIIVGFPGETDADLPGAADLHRVAATDASPRFSVFGSARDSSASRLQRRSTAPTFADAGGRMRASVERNAAAFRRFAGGPYDEQRLTVDDGSSVVTGNYLKIRISEPHPRNKWVAVKVESAEPLLGRASPY